MLSLEVMGAQTSNLDIACGVCRLRPFTQRDASSLTRNANNPKIARNLRDKFPSPYTLQDADIFIDHVSRPTRMGHELVLAIDVDGLAVGSIGLTFGDDIERCSAELGYWIGEEHWGRGIVTAAITRLVDVTFRDLPITRIFAKPFFDNLPSRRVLEKVNFRMDSVLWKAAIKQGKLRDVCLYSRTSDKDFI